MGAGSLGAGKMSRARRRSKSRHQSPTGKSSVLPLFANRMALEFCHPSSFMCCWWLCFPYNGWAEQWHQRPPGPHSLTHVPSGSLQSKLASPCACIALSGRSFCHCGDIPYLLRRGGPPNPALKMHPRNYLFHMKALVPSGYRAGQSTSKRKCKQRIATGPLP